MTKTNKKLTFILLTILIIVLSLFISMERAYSLESINIDAKAGIIYLADMDEILYEKGADHICDMASVTKLLTTSVALEYLELTDIVTFQEESMTVDDLLHMVLMESNNEGALCLAEAAAVKAKTDLNGFIALMNDKVQSLGCTSTNIYNPSGLYDENMTCIEDVIKIAKDAFSNDIIRTVAGTSSYRLENGSIVETTNLFLRNSESSDLTIKVPEGATLIAAKTGTYGHEVYRANMVALCKINGMECYVAELDSEPDCRYSDMSTLMNEAMGLINPYTVFEGNCEFGEGKIWEGAVNTIVGVSKEEGLINLPQGVSPSLVTTKTVYYDKLTAPIEEGSIIGHINIYLSDEEIRSVELIAKDSIPKGWFLSKYRITNKQTIIIGAVAFVIVFLIILMFIVRASNLKKKKRLREERLREEARKKLEIERDRERRNWKYR